MSPHLLQPTIDQVYPRERLRILLVLALAYCFIAVEWTRSILGQQPAGVDYLPMWTAARLIFDHPAAVYDFSAITELQRWLIDESWDVQPFVYPPSMLLLLAPFSRFGFWISYALWVTFTAGLYLWSAARSLPNWRALWVVFLVTSPPFVVTMLAGQTSALMAGLLLLGLSMLEARPVVAGVLLGLAACVKPSLLALAPLCLLAGGHYRAFGAAAVVCVTLVLASLAAFGFAPWLDWISALAEFQKVVNGNPGLVRNMITPAGAALQLGMEGTPLAVLRVVCAIAGVAVAWIGFREPRPLEQRVATLIASGLLASPYVMRYDALLLVPAAMAVLIRGTAGFGSGLMGTAAMLLVMCTCWPYVAPYATIGLIVLLLRFDFSLKTT